MRLRFQLLQLGVQFLHELDERHAHRAAKGAQFDNIHAPLAALTARHENLILAQSFRQRFLSKANRLSRLAQAREENFVLLCENRLEFRPHVQVRLHTKTDYT